MGCHIQVRAFLQQDDKVEIYIGFEGDETETSILVMKEGDKSSRLHTFERKQFSEYDKNWQYYICANQENGAREYPIETFATCDNKFLNKLWSRLKVGDYYYNDEETVQLIHGLRVVLPYYRNGSKNYYIRHLQWHNLYQAAPKWSQKEATQVTPPPESSYASWATW
ncbi:TPA: hypothetical protein U9M35_002924 [Acinetobacter baumannii]|nr:hypothetical protein [Acinetobacter baumannii]